jgi:hypothetical protein
VKWAAVFNTCWISKYEALFSAYLDFAKQTSATSSGTPFTDYSTVLRAKSFEAVVQVYWASYAANFNTYLPEANCLNSEVSYCLL